MADNSSVIPSAKDLIMVLPRLARKAGSFALFDLPEHADTVWTMIKNGGIVIANATGANTTSPSLTHTSSAFVQATSAAADMTLEMADSKFSTWLSSAYSFESIRGFGGMFTYFSSRWAIATFAMVRYIMLHNHHRPIRL